MTGSSPVTERAGTRPILFSGAMIRALLDGSKTQTRRVLSPQPDAKAFDYSHAKRGQWHKPGREVDRFRGVGVDTKSRRAVFESGDSGGPINAFADGADSVRADVHCPFGAIGGLLWVRETFCPVDDREHGGELWYDYRATPKYSAEHPAGWENAPNDREALKWKPSIFMPRAACRIELEITNVRAERLQAISEDDCIAEGIASRGIKQPCIASAMLYIDDYRELWDSLNAKRGYGWDVNPWVWVVEFKRAGAP